MKLLTLSYSEILKLQGNKLYHKGMAGAVAVALGLTTLQIVGNLVLSK